jgi:hypothetical protein
VVGTDPATADELGELERLRPRTRGDCIDGPRPCPFAGCRWHLGLRVQKNGTILVSLPAADYRETDKGRCLNPRKVPGGIAEITRLIEVAAEHVAGLPEGWSCALDVADRVADGEPISYVPIAEHLGVDRERVRQIAEEALAKIRESGIDLEAPIDKDEWTP